MKKITIIGAGTMGAGIAQVCAHKGHEVSVVDMSEEALNKGEQSISRSLDRLVSKEKCSPDEQQATLSRISYGTALASACSGAQLIIEAATESLETKKKLFESLSHHADPQAILATNTSSISITQIAASTSRPEQVIGMHFMNPVPIMPLIEVICGYATSSETRDQVLSLAHQLGKTPIEVQDYPGFVSNRVLMTMINEAIYTLHEGIAQVEAIDQIMQLGMSHPMGPLRLADFIGLDVCLSILQVLYKGFSLPKYAPCPKLVNMVAAGYLGIKTKEGFYVYENHKPVGVSQRLQSH